MPTLAELGEMGELYKLDPELPSGRQPERLFYASERLMRWLTEQLPQIVSNWGLESSPEEQVAVMLEEFCAGGELAFGQRFHILHPGEQGVWELKSADTRIFGWFVHRDCFVGFVGDSAERVKRYGLYTGYVGETVRFREQLPLNPPKFIADEDPHAVVSAYHYP